MSAGDENGPGGRTLEAESVGKKSSNLRDSHAQATRGLPIHSLRGSRDSYIGIATSNYIHERAKGARNEPVADEERVRSAHLRTSRDTI